MNAGKLARSRSCANFIVWSALMMKRKSTLPWQPAGCCGPKSGIAISRTGKLSAVEPELVEADVEVELEEPAPSAAEVDEEPELELLEPAGPIVTVEPMPFESPVEPAFPPQAARSRKRAIGSEAARTRRPV